MNWMLSNAVGGVKVQVAESDYEHAVEVLGSKGPEWRCPSCGEDITGDFDVCWLCGASRDDAAARKAGAKGCEAAAESVTGPGESPTAGMEWAPSDADLSNPYRSPRAPPGAFDPETVEPVDPRDTAEGDAIVGRAWRASVFGMVFCPFLLQFYSSFLLLSVAFRGLPLSQSGARQYYAAWIVNIGFALVPVGLVLLVRDFPR